MHLSIEELPASWVVKLFGEVGGGVPEYFSSGEFFFSKLCSKSYHEKTVLKTLQLEFSPAAFIRNVKIWNIMYQ